MGAWEELDTEITVELDTTELDDLISKYDGNEIYSELANYVKRLKKGWEDGSKRAVKELATKDQSFQEQYIMDKCENPTGMLKSSIQLIQQSPYSIVVGTNINHIYPMSIEYGRKEVVPIRAKRLAFYNEDGVLIFPKKSAKADAKPFVAPAYKRVDSIAEKLTWIEIGKAIKNAG